VIFGERDFNIGNSRTYVFILTCHNVNIGHKAAVENIG
jgi:hypothetical protein